MLLSFKDVLPHEMAELAGVLHPQAQLLDVSIPPVSRRSRVQVYRSTADQGRTSPAARQLVSLLTARDNLPPEGAQC